MNKYPRFVQALNALGTTSQQAKKLHISRAALHDLRSNLPRQLKQYRDCPFVLQALAEDFEDLRQSEDHTANAPAAEPVGEPAAAEAVAV